MDFNSNKNQYRKIVDANMYLVVVLRYRTDCSNKACISDNGLLSDLENTGSNTIDLNKYPIFQDKRAYLYEGSFLYTPCDENVNYFVVNDFFYSNEDITGSIPGYDVVISQKDRYGRPILKNFMNYKEFLGSEFYSMNIFYLISIMMMILL